MSYLLTGVTATGDDGHTAHFHDCRDTLVSTIIARGSLKANGGIEYVHFIVKVPVSGEVGGWFVEIRNGQD